MGRFVGLALFFNQLGGYATGTRLALLLDNSKPMEIRP